MVAFPVMSEFLILKMAIKVLKIRLHLKHLKIKLIEEKQEL